VDAVTCVDCADWFGCCHSGEREKRLRYSRVASSDACEKFRPKEPLQQES
jgi:hypothetical protein